jgi:hypothetical protein
MIERYLGGGKLFFSKYNGTDYDAEVEIGEIQSANLKIDTTEAEAYSKDTGVKKKIDKVVTEINSNFSFTTQNVNKENMAMAMLGDLDTETFAIGDTLPDGTVATVEVVLPVIIGGVNPIIQGKIKCVGVNVSGKDNPVLLIHHAFVKASGDIRDYFADKHTTLSFESEITEIDGEYFKEYFMPKA